jgi:DNA-binding MarR family transcriptional regulator
MDQPPPPHAPSPLPPATTGLQKKAASVRVLRQFRQIFNAVKTQFQQVEKTVGLGGAQVWALSLIQDTPGIGVGKLAEAMDIHQSTASNLVRALTERGFVQASRTSPDRRAVSLVLLTAGSEVLQRAPAPFAGVLPDALARLSDAALSRIESDLATLIDQLQTPDAAHCAHLPMTADAAVAAGVGAQTC